MALDATVGGVNANSYATRAEADTYFTNHPLFDTWDAIIDADQEALLIHATRLLDQFDYIGDVATTTQALQWPRIENDLYEVTFANNVIPPKLKYAEFEAALWLQTSGGVAVAAGTVSELDIGSSVKVKYSAGSSAFVDTSVDPQGFPTGAARFLKGLRIINVLA
jgi:hypothetical protein